MVVFQYIMAWDYFVSPYDTTGLYAIYPTIIFMLNLLLIINMNRWVKNGIYSAFTHRVYDYKPNNSHNNSI